MILWGGHARHRHYGQPYGPLQEAATPAGEETGRVWHLATPRDWHSAAFTTFSKKMRGGL